MTSSRRALLLVALFVAVATALALLPAPSGLSREGQRVLAVIVLAIGLWATEALPAGVTSMVVVVALVTSGGVPTVREGLAGFAEPVAYFLLAVLTIGLAVSRSGLAERLAVAFLHGSRGRPRMLYAQLCLGMPLLTLVLPSATTRTGILVHVYERALAMGGLPHGATLTRAVMLALNSINRLASSVLLTGGMTPIVAAALIGGMSWTRWLVLMGVPYLALLALGAVLIAILYREGFRGTLAIDGQPARTPMTAVEWRTAAITAGASVLWLTDALHHWDPVMPALLAWACLLAPGIGVLTWREFEEGVGWTNLFVIATSLSIARALVRSGAAAWLARVLLPSPDGMAGQPLGIVAGLLVASAVIRFLVPNITGFLGITIPVAMSLGANAGLDPVVCALVVLVSGDAVLYYPAQAASSLVVYQRGHLTAAEILKFGLWMTALGFLVVLAVGLPWWSLVGEPLTRPR